MPREILLNTKIDRLVKYLPDLLTNISERDDEQIIRIAIEAQRLERFAFLVRGACAFVLRHRYPHRLSGGRGRRDNSGQGIQAQMAQLARQVGIERRTLETDARIIGTFFREGIETALAHIPTLAREYYVTALAAPEPQAAIKVAIEKREDPQYNLRIFRAYVSELKRGDATSVTTSELKSGNRLRIFIPAEAQSSLREIARLTGQSIEEVVTDAILKLHHLIIRRQTRKPEVEPSQLTFVL